jgi:hypothetical protein
LIPVPDSSAILEVPTLSRRSAETLLLGYTAMVESSAQEHVAALSPEKLSRRVQMNAFVNPPLFVGASNFTCTLLPSLLKVAEKSCGTAGAAWIFSTVKVPSAMAPEGYCAALAPDTVTRIVYFPGVTPSKVIRAEGLEALLNWTLAGENARSLAALVSASTADSVSDTEDNGSALKVMIKASCAAAPVNTLTAEKLAETSAATEG